MDLVSVISGRRRRLLFSGRKLCPDKTAEDAIIKESTAYPAYADRDGGRCNMTAKADNAFEITKVSEASGYMDNYV